MSIPDRSSPVASVGLSMRDKPKPAKKQAEAGSRLLQFPYKFRRERFSRIAA
jgi:hypothetical protein